MASTLWNLAANFSTDGSPSLKSCADQHHDFSLLAIAVKEQTSETKIKLSKFSVLTNEVCDGFESFFLAHQKADAFACFVPHQLAVANTSFFPLVISESVELDAKLKNTFETFCASFDSNFWQINLKRNC